jgi:hypothetical protein
LFYGGRGGGETRCLRLNRGHRLRIFRNTVLGKIFGHKKEDLTGNWNKLLPEEVYSLHSKVNTTGAIDSISLMWAGHVARVGRREIHAGFWLGNVRERDRLESVA